MRKFESVSFRDDVKLPRRATKSSGGYDFFANDEFEVLPGESYVYWSGVKVVMPVNEVLLMVPRSSMGRYGIRFANTIGVIDSDYHNNPTTEGEIAFHFVNDGHLPWKVNVGDRIGQGIFVQYSTTYDDDAEGERTGGMGSTGK